MSRKTIIHGWLWTVNDEMWILVPAPAQSKTVDLIRDCRKSPDSVFWLFPHLVKSTTYKWWLVPQLKVLGFFDSLSL